MKTKTFMQTLDRLSKEKQTNVEVETSKQVITTEFTKLQMMNSLTTKQRLEMEFLENTLNFGSSSDLIRIANKK